VVKKYRGKIRMTAELLHRALGLPEEVEIINVAFDNNREIVNVIVRSDEEVENLTYHTGEGMEFPTTDTEIHIGDVKDA
jgi:hypothetical protein